MRPPETSLRSQGSWSPFSLAIKLRIARTSRASFAVSRGSGEDGGDRASDLRGEARLAGDDPRPRQRHVLPGLGLAGLVELEGGELRRQRPLAPGGAQAQIDFVELSRLGRRGQRGDQALRQARVIDHGAERPRAVGFARRRRENRRSTIRSRSEAAVISREPNLPMASTATRPPCTRP